MFTHSHKRVNVVNPLAVPEVTLLARMAKRSLPPREAYGKRCLRQEKLTLREAYAKINLTPKEA